MPHSVNLPILQNERYIVQKRLGGGGFCEVVVALDTESMLPYALKILDRKKPIFQKGKEDIIEKKLRSFMRREAQVMGALDHPNIVKFFGIYENEFECFIILEIVDGGELYDKIVTKERISEVEAKVFIRQLIEAVQYIHLKGFVHRDIKPENILLDNTSKPSLIKLADFGLSREISGKMFTNCGTIDYCAPELLLNRMGRQGYGKEVDHWSIGVVVYVTLCGYQPFMVENHNEEQLRQHIITGKYKFHKQYWRDISASAKMFVSSILKVKPEERATFDTMLRDAWMTDSEDAESRILVAVGVTNRLGGSPQ